MEHEEALWAEESGYYKCKLDVIELIKARQLELSELSKTMRQEISETKSLIKGQKLITDHAKLVGEMDGLSRLAQLASSLRPVVDKKNQ